MNRITQVFIKYPWVTLSIVLGITIFMAFGASKIETQNNHSSELPDTDPIVLTINRLEDIFGDKDVVLIAIKSQNVYSEATLTKIQALSEELKGIDGIAADEVTSLSTVNNIEGTEDGLDVGPLFDQVPTTESEIAAIRKSVESNRLLKGRLVSEDGTFSVIIANIEEGYEQTKLAASIFALKEKYEGTDKIYLAGDPIQQEEIDRGIQKDIRMLMPLALLLTLVCYFLAFRSAKGVILPFLVVILSVLWAMGTMGHLGFKMNVVTSAIPLLMIAVSSSYGIHLMARYYDERFVYKKEEAVSVSLRKVLPAILLTGITSALGSFTLLVFKVTSIQEFGLITTIGILNIIIITVTVIPALLIILKSETVKRKDIRDGAFERFLISLSGFAIRRRALVMVTAVIVTGIAIVGVLKVRIGNDFIEYFPKKHELRTSFEQFRENLGGASYMDIMVDGKVADAMKNPQLLKKVTEFQSFIENQEGVGYTSSFADIIRRMNKEMNSGQAEYETIPDSQDLVAQYLLLYSMSGDPDDFTDLVDYDYQRAKIRVMLTTTEQDIHKQLYNNMKAYADANFGTLASVEYGGDVMFWLAQVQYIVTGKLQNLILAIITVFVFCIIVFRSLSGGFISVVPLTISSLMTFGLMGFTGIRLETGTAIITAVGVGIGIDFAIHMLMRFREEKELGHDTIHASEITMVTSGKAVIYDMLSNIFGFIVFALSGFVPLQNFGWLISFTMLTVAISSLLVIPALISYIDPRFLQFPHVANNMSTGNERSQKHDPLHHSAIYDEEHISIEA